MALSALNRDATPAIIADTVNRLVTEFNRMDTRVPIYGTDTGSGTAYAIAPIPGITQYQLGQIFEFIAVNANTGAAPTLNVNGKGAGLITRPGGVALVAGDIAAGSAVEVRVTGTSPVTFQLLSPVATPITLTGATTFLGLDVALNNVANFFDGPNTGSIGANGQTWLISGVAAVAEAGVGGTFSVRLHDGTNAIAGGGVLTYTPSGETVATYMAVVSLTGPTTFTLQARDSTGTTGSIKTTSGAPGSPANKATSITAVRLA